MNESKPALSNNEEHRNAVHNRWMDRRNRKQESGTYEDIWYGQQCGACRFFVPLMGMFASDWGGCTNLKSAFDRRIMFEHDGCDSFEEASDSWGEWLEHDPG